MKLLNSQPSKRKFHIKINPTFEQIDDQVEWVVSIDASREVGEVETSPADPKVFEADIDVESGKSRTFNLVVGTPKGGFRGDTLKLAISVGSEDGLNSTTSNLSITLVPVIVTLKTTLGSEMQFSEDLIKKNQKEGSSGDNEVISIMSPIALKGYVFVEAMHPDRVAFAARGIRSFKGMIEGVVKFEEIAHYLTPRPAVSGLELGSIIELIGGPFKGEKAKITNIDAGKEEVTVQLIESMVPIPVTVKAEAIRVLDRK
ncbi:MAG: transcription elongation factor Spt5 [Candidatus Thermoplasmatota archaeon]|nr:transcription elongation factor Spt5 [Candidatus Thermoplasmatota archaeon]